MKNSREDFLNAVRDIVAYWSETAKYPNMAAQGVAFSIMALLDGVSTSNLYGYTLTDNETNQVITVDELHADL